MKGFFFGRESRRYLPIEEACEDGKPIHEKFHDGNKSFRHPKRVSKPLRESDIIHSACWLWLNIALFAISSTMFILSLRTKRPSYTSNSEKPRNYLLKQMSMASRVLDEIDIRIEPKRMDATLLQSKPLSIFRQEPSYEVDLAWQKIVDTRPIPLSREEVLAIGKDPGQAVQIPGSWGLGNESYFGRVDVFHQLHCLNALRREAYFEHYYGKSYPNGFNDTGEFHRLHLSHCVYLLLQNIMCNANTDVYTHIWTDTLDHPFPDFNIDHQCKDFDAILEWQGRNAVDEKAFVDLKRPDGYPYHVMTHKFKEIHGWFLNHEDDGDLSRGEIA